MKLENGTKVCVLLVERNVDARELFSELFMMFGCEVITAKNGGEAITTVTAKRPHIVFSSLILEDANGLELCKDLRTRPSLSETVFVAMTGYEEPGFKQRVLDAGFNHYILKPADMPAMLAPFRDIPSLKDDGTIERCLSAMQSPEADEY